MPPKRGKVRAESLESGDDSEEYKKKRARNNMAVRKSRVKSKMKTQETMNRVNELKRENTALEEKVKILTQELGYLKDLFLAHASSNASENKFQHLDLEKLLSDDPSARTDHKPS